VVQSLTLREGPPDGMQTFVRVLRASRPPAFVVGLTAMVRRTHTLHPASQRAEVFRDDESIALHA